MSTQTAFSPVVPLHRTATAPQPSRLAAAFRAFFKAVSKSRRQQAERAPGWRVYPRDTVLNDQMERQIERRLLAPGRRIRP